ncbi:PEP-CTERM sorting domain-containing protein [Pseudoduganella sp. FT55W]|uniref:PEP-CTERM sorting domain-containing protein n=2 Tax=Duganella rivi TaxID=2666083 RepID=A0A7X4GSI5_9BURK|nr:PEP-CTERM sorting domain-containing protein [Duganella rivi]
MKSFTFSLDISVAEIADGFPGGWPMRQQLILELRDHDKPGDVTAYSSVWYSLGVIGDGLPADQHLSVTVLDTSSGTLPAGWNGYGAFDQNYESHLPYGQSFARILKDVDEMAIVSMRPDSVQGTVIYYNLAIDNIKVSAVPEPASYSMLLAGLGLLGWAARRRVVQQ